MDDFIKKFIEDPDKAVLDEHKTAAYEKLEKIIIDEGKVFAEYYVKRFMGDCIIRGNDTIQIASDIFIGLRMLEYIKNYEG